MEENVIEIDSESEEDEEKEERNLHNHLHRKALSIILRQRNKELTYDQFQYKQLRELSNELKIRLRNYNFEPSKSYIWKNVICWILHIKNSYEDVQSDEKFNLILTDFVMQYVNYKCENYSNSRLINRNDINENIDEILNVFTTLFREKSLYIILTLLKINVEDNYKELLYPIFNKYLSTKNLLCTNDIISYLALVLCYKKWQKLAYTTDEKRETSIPDGILMKETPIANSINNQPFVKIYKLIKKASSTTVTISNQENSSKTTFELNNILKRYFVQYERYVGLSDTLCDSMSSISLSDKRSQKINFPQTIGEQQQSKSQTQQKQHQNQQSHQQEKQNQQHQQLQQQRQSNQSSLSNTIKNLRINDPLNTSKTTDKQHSTFEENRDKTNTSSGKINSNLRKGNNNLFSSISNSNNDKLGNSVKSSNNSQSNINDKNSITNDCVTISDNNDNLESALIVKNSSLSLVSAYNSDSESVVILSDDEDESNKKSSDKQKNNEQNDAIVTLSDDDDEEINRSRQEGNNNSSSSSSSSKQQKQGNSSSNKSTKGTSGKNNLLSPRKQLSSRRPSSINNNNDTAGSAGTLRSSLPPSSFPRNSKSESFVSCRQKQKCIQGEVSSTTSYDTQNSDYETASSSTNSISSLEVHSTEGLDNNLLNEIDTGPIRTSVDDAISSTSELNLLEREVSNMSINRNSPFSRRTSRKSFCNDNPYGLEFLEPHSFNENNNCTENLDVIEVNDNKKMNTDNNDSLSEPRISRNEIINKFDKNSKNQKLNFGEGTSRMALKNDLFEMKSNLRETDKTVVSDAKVIFSSTTTPSRQFESSKKKEFSDVTDNILDENQTKSSALNKTYSLLSDESESESSNISCNAIFSAKKSQTFNASMNAEDSLFSSISTDSQDVEKMNSSKIDEPLKSTSTDQSSNEKLLEDMTDSIKQYNLDKEKISIENNVKPLNLNETVNESRFEASDENEKNEEIHQKSHVIVDENNVESCETHKSSNENVVLGEKEKEKEKEEEEDKLEMKKQQQEDIECISDEIETTEQEKTPINDSINERLDQSANENLICNSLKTELNNQKKEIINKSQFIVDDDCDKSVQKEQNKNKSLPEIVDDDVEKNENESTNCLSTKEPIENRIDTEKMIQNDSSSTILQEDINLNKNLLEICTETAVNLKEIPSVLNEMIESDENKSNKNNSCDLVIENNENNIEEFSTDGAEKKTDDENSEEKENDNEKDQSNKTDDDIIKELEMAIQDSENTCEKIYDPPFRISDIESDKKKDSDCIQQKSTKVEKQITVTKLASTSAETDEPEEEEDDDDDDDDDEEEELFVDKNENEKNKNLGKGQNLIEREISVKTSSIEKDPVPFSVHELTICNDKENDEEITDSITENDDDFSEKNKKYTIGSIHQIKDSHSIIKEIDDEMNSIDNDRIDQNETQIENSNDQINEMTRTEFPMMRKNEIQQENRKLTIANLLKVTKIDSRISKLEQEAHSKVKKEIYENITPIISDLENEEIENYSDNENHICQVKSTKTDTFIVQNSQGDEVKITEIKMITLPELEQYNEIEKEIRSEEKIKIKENSTSNKSIHSKKSKVDNEKRGKQIVTDECKESKKHEKITTNITAEDTDENSLSDDLDKFIIPRFHENSSKPPPRVYRGPRKAQKQNERVLSSIKTLKSTRSPDRYSQNSHERLLDEVPIDIKNFTYHQNESEYYKEMNQKNEIDTLKMTDKKRRNSLGKSYHMDMDEDFETRANQFEQISTYCSRVQDSGGTKSKIVPSSRPSQNDNYIERKEIKDLNRIHSIERIDLNEQNTKSKVKGRTSKQMMRKRKYNTDKYSKMLDNNITYSSKNVQNVNANKSRISKYENKNVKLTKDIPLNSKNSKNIYSNKNDNNCDQQKTIFVSVVDPPFNKNKSIFNSSNSGNSKKEDKLNLVDSIKPFIIVSENKNPREKQSSSKIIDMPVRSKNLGTFSREIETSSDMPVRPKNLGTFSREIETSSDMPVRPKGKRLISAVLTQPPRPTIHDIAKRLSTIDTSSQQKQSILSHETELNQIPEQKIDDYIISRKPYQQYSTEIIPSIMNVRQRLENDNKNQLQTTDNDVIETKSLQKFNQPKIVKLNPNLLRSSNEDKLRLIHSIQRNELLGQKRLSLSKISNNELTSLNRLNYSSYLFKIPYSSVNQNQLNETRSTDSNIIDYSDMDEIEQLETDYDDISSHRSIKQVYIVNDKVFEIENDSCDPYETLIEEISSGGDADTNSNNSDTNNMDSLVNQQDNITNLKNIGKKLLLNYSEIEKQSSSKTNSTEISDNEKELFIVIDNLRREKVDMFIKNKLKGQLYLESKTGVTDENKQLNLISPTDSECNRNDFIAIEKNETIKSDEKFISNIIGDGKIDENIINEIYLQQSNRNFDLLNVPNFSSCSLIQNDQDSDKCIMQKLQECPDKNLNIVQESLNIQNKEDIIEESISSLEDHPFIVYDNNIKSSTEEEEYEPDNEIITTKKYTREKHTDDLIISEKCTEEEEEHANEIFIPEKYTQEKSAEKYVQEESADEIITTEKYTQEESADEVIAAEKYTQEESADEIASLEKYSQEESVDEIISLEKYSQEGSVDEVISPEKYTQEGPIDEMITLEKYTQQESTDEIIISEKYTEEESSQQQTTIETETCENQDTTNKDKSAEELIIPDNFKEIISYPSISDVIEEDINSSDSKTSSITNENNEKLPEGNEDVVKETQNNIENSTSFNTEELKTNDIHKESSMEQKTDTVDKRNEDETVIVDDVPKLSEKNIIETNYSNINKDFNQTSGLIIHESLEKHDTSFEEGTVVVESIQESIPHTFSYLNEFRQEERMKEIIIDDIMNDSDVIEEDEEGLKRDNEIDLTISNELETTQIDVIKSDVRIGDICNESTRLLKINENENDISVSNEIETVDTNVITSDFQTDEICDESTRLSEINEDKSNLSVSNEIERSETDVIKPDVNIDEIYNENTKLSVINKNENDISVFKEIETADATIAKFDARTNEDTELSETNENNIPIPNEIETNVIDNQIDEICNEESTEFPETNEDTNNIPILSEIETTSTDIITSDAQVGEESTGFLENNENESNVKISNEVKANDTDIITFDTRIVEIYNEENTGISEINEKENDISTINRTEITDIIAPPSNVQIDEMFNDSRELSIEDKNEDAISITSKVGTDSLLDDYIAITAFDVQTEEVGYESTTSMVSNENENDNEVDKVDVANLTIDSQINEICNENKELSINDKSEILASSDIETVNVSVRTSDVQIDKSFNEEINLSTIEDGKDENNTPTSVDANTLDIDFEKTTDVVQVKEICDKSKIDDNENKIQTEYDTKITNTAFGINDIPVDRIYNENTELSMTTNENENNIRTSTCLEGTDTSVTTSDIQNNKVQNENISLSASDESENNIVTNENKSLTKINENENNISISNHERIADGITSKSESIPEVAQNLIVSNNLESIKTMVTEVKPITSNDTLKSPPLPVTQIPAITTVTESVHREDRVPPKVHWKKRLSQSGLAADFESTNNSNIVSLNTRISGNEELSHLEKINTNESNSKTIITTNTAVNEANSSNSKTKNDQTFWMQNIGLCKNDSFYTRNINNLTSENDDETIEKTVQQKDLIESDNQLVKYNDKNVDFQKSNIQTPEFIQPIKEISPYNLNLLALTCEQLVATGNVSSVTEQDKIVNSTPDPINQNESTIDVERDFLKIRKRPGRKKKDKSTPKPLPPKSTIKTRGSCTQDEKNEINEEVKLALKQDFKLKSILKNPDKSRSQNNKTTRFAEETEILIHDSTKNLKDFSKKMTTIMNNRGKQTITTEDDSTFITIQKAPLKECTSVSDENKKIKEKSNLEYYHSSKYAKALNESDSMDKAKQQILTDENVVSNLKETNSNRQKSMEIIKDVTSDSTKKISSERFDIWNYENDQNSSLETENSEIREETSDNLVQQTTPQKDVMPQSLYRSFIDSKISPESEYILPDNNDSAINKDNNYVKIKVEVNDTEQDEITDRSSSIYTMSSPSILDSLTTSNHQQESLLTPIQHKRKKGRPCKIIRAIDTVPFATLVQPYDNDTLSPNKITSSPIQTNVEVPVKNRRGRPPSKNKIQKVVTTVNQAKGRRGRPRKIPNDNLQKQIKTNKVNLLPNIQQHNEMLQTAGSPIYENSFSEYVLKRYQPKILEYQIEEEQMNQISEVTVEKSVSDKFVENIPEATDKEEEEKINNEIKIKFAIGKIQQAAKTINKINTEIELNQIRQLVDESTVTTAPEYLKENLLEKQVECNDDDGKDEESEEPQREKQITNEFQINHLEKLSENANVPLEKDLTEKYNDNDGKENESEESSQGAQVSSGFKIIPDQSDELSENQTIPSTPVSLENDLQEKQVEYSHDDDKEMQPEEFSQEKQTTDRFETNHSDELSENETILPTPIPSENDLHEKQIEYSHDDDEEEKELEKSSQEKQTTDIIFETNHSDELSENEARLTTPIPLENDLQEKQIEYSHDDDDEEEKELEKSSQEKQIKDEFHTDQSDELSENETILTTPIPLENDLQEKQIKDEFHTDQSDELSENATVTTTPVSLEEDLEDSSQEKQISDSSSCYAITDQTSSEESEVTSVDVISTEMIESAVKGIEQLNIQSDTSLLEAEVNDKESNQEKLPENNSDVTNNEKINEPLNSEKESLSVFKEVTDKLPEISITPAQNEIEHSENHEINDSQNELQSQHENVEKDKTKKQKQRKISEIARRMSVVENHYEPMKSCNKSQIPKKYDDTLKIPETRENHDSIREIGIKDIPKRKRKGIPSKHREYITDKLNMHYDFTVTEPEEIECAARENKENNSISVIEATSITKENDYLKNNEKRIAPENLNEAFEKEIDQPIDLSITPKLNSSFLIRNLISDISEKSDNDDHVSNNLESNNLDSEKEICKNKNRLSTDKSIDVENQLKETEETEQDHEEIESNASRIKETNEVTSEKNDAIIINDKISEPSNSEEIIEISDSDTAAEMAAAISAIEESTMRLKISDESDDDEQRSQSEKEKSPSPTISSTENEEEEEGEEEEKEEEEEEEEEEEKEGEEEEKEKEEEKEETEQEEDAVELTDSQQDDNDLESSEYVSDLIEETTENEVLETSSCSLSQYEILLKEIKLTDDTSDEEKKKSSTDEVNLESEKQPEERLDNKKSRENLLENIGDSVEKPERVKGTIPENEQQDNQTVAIEKECIQQKKMETILTETVSKNNQISIIETEERIQEREIIENEASNENLVTDLEIKSKADDTQEQQEISNQEVIDTSDKQFFSFHFQNENNKNYTMESVKENLVEEEQSQVTDEEISEVEKPEIIESIMVRDKSTVNENELELCPVTVSEEKEEEEISNEIQAETNLEQELQKTNEKQVIVETEIEHEIVENLKIQEIKELISNEEEQVDKESSETSKKHEDEEKEKSVEVSINSDIENIKNVDDINKPENDLIEPTTDIIENVSVDSKTSIPREKTTKKWSTFFVVRTQKRRATTGLSMQSQNSSNEKRRKTIDVRPLKSVINDTNQLNDEIVEDQSEIESFDKDNSSEKNEQYVNNRTNQINDEITKIENKILADNISSIDSVQKILSTGEVNKEECTEIKITSENVEMPTKHVREIKDYKKKKSLVDQEEVVKHQTEIKQRSSDNNLKEDSKILPVTSVNVSKINEELVRNYDQVEENSIQVAIENISNKKIKKRKMKNRWKMSRPKQKRKQYKFRKDIKLKSKMKKCKVKIKKLKPEFISSFALKYLKNENLKEINKFDIGNEISQQNDIKIESKRKQENIEFKTQLKTEEVFDGIDSKKLDEIIANKTTDIELKESNEIHSEKQIIRTEIVKIDGRIKQNAEQQTQSKIEKATVTDLDKLVDTVLEEILQNSKSQNDNEIHSEQIMKINTTEVEKDVEPKLQFESEKISTNNNHYSAEPIDKCSNKVSKDSELQDTTEIHSKQSKSQKLIMVDSNELVSVDTSSNEIIDSKLQDKIESHSKHTVQIEKIKLNDKPKQNVYHEPVVAKNILDDVIKSELQDTIKIQSEQIDETETIKTIDKHNKMENKNDTKSEDKESSKLMDTTFDSTIPLKNILDMDNISLFDTEASLSNTEKIVTSEELQEYIQQHYDASKENESESKEEEKMKPIETEVIENSNLNFEDVTNSSSVCDWPPLKESNDILTDDIGLTIEDTFKHIEILEKMNSGKTMEAFDWIDCFPKLQQPQQKENQNNNYRKGNEMIGGGMISGGKMPEGSLGADVLVALLENNYMTTYVEAETNEFSNLNIPNKCVNMNKILKEECVSKSQQSQSTCENADNSEKSDESDDYLQDYVNTFDFLNSLDVVTSNAIECQLDTDSSNILDNFSIDMYLPASSTVENNNLKNTITTKITTTTATAPITATSTSTVTTVTATKSSSSVPQSIMTTEFSQTVETQTDLIAVAQKEPINKAVSNDTNTTKNNLDAYLTPILSLDNLADGCLAQSTPKKVNDNKNESSLISSSFCLSDSLENKLRKNILGSILKDAPNTNSSTEIFNNFYISEKDLNEASCSNSTNTDEQCKPKLSPSISTPSNKRSPKKLHKTDKTEMDLSNFENKTVKKSEVTTVKNSIKEQNSTSPSSFSNDTVHIESKTIVNNISESPKKQSSPIRSPRIPDNLDNVPVTIECNVSTIKPIVTNSLPQVLQSGKALDMPDLCTIPTAVTTVSTVSNSESTSDVVIITESISPTTATTITTTAVTTITTSDTIQITSDSNKAVNSSSEKNIKNSPKVTNSTDYLKKKLEIEKDLSSMDPFDRLKNETTVDVPIPSKSKSRLKRSSLSATKLPIPFPVSENKSTTPSSVISDDYISQSPTVDHATRSPIIDVVSIGTTHICPSPASVYSSPSLNTTSSPLIVRSPYYSNTTEVVSSSPLNSFTSNEQVISRSTTPSQSLNKVVCSETYLNQSPNSQKDKSSPFSPSHPKSINLSVNSTSPSLSTKSSTSSLSPCNQPQRVQSVSSPINIQSASSAFKISSPSSVDSVRCYKRKKSSSSKYEHVSESGSTPQPKCTKSHKRKHSDHVTDQSYSTIPPYKRSVSPDYKVVTKRSYARQLESFENLLSASDHSLSRSEKHNKKDILDKLQRISNSSSLSSEHIYARQPSSNQHKHSSIKSYDNSKQTKSTILPISSSPYQFQQSKSSRTTSHTLPPPEPKQINLSISQGKQPPIETLQSSTKSNHPTKSGIFIINKCPPYNKIKVSNNIKTPTNIQQQKSSSVYGSVKPYDRPSDNIPVQKVETANLKSSSSIEHTINEIRSRLESLPEPHYYKEHRERKRLLDELAELEKKRDKMFSKEKSKSPHHSTIVTNSNNINNINTNNTNNSISNSNSSHISSTRYGSSSYRQQDRFSPYPKKHTNTILSSHSSHESNISDKPHIIHHSYITPRHHHHHHHHLSSPGKVIDDHFSLHISSSSSSSSYKAKPLTTVEPWSYEAVDVSELIEKLRQKKD